MGYFTCVMSSVTGNLCNKCPKWLVKQNSSYSDYFNAISGFTSNSRAPGGPVTLRVELHFWWDFLHFIWNFTANHMLLPYFCMKLI